MSIPSILFFVGRDFGAYGEVRTIARELNVHDAFHSSAEDFLEGLRAEASGCVVLASGDDERTAPDFIRRLNQSDCYLPVIVLAGAEAATVDRAVEAMKCGAAEFLARPYDAPRMRRAVETCLERAAAIDDIRRLREKTVALYDALTTRERQILELVVAGKPTKNIAHELGTSRNTVQNQRASILRKMQARSVVDIVRLRILMQLGESLMLQGLDRHDAGIELYRSLAAADEASAGETTPHDWTFRAKAA